MQDTWDPWNPSPAIPVPQASIALTRKAWVHPLISLGPTDVRDLSVPREGLPPGETFPLPGPAVPRLPGGRGPRGRIPEPLVGRAGRLSDWGGHRHLSGESRSHPSLCSSGPAPKRQNCSVMLKGIQSLRDWGDCCLLLSHLACSHLWNVPTRSCHGEQNLKRCHHTLQLK